MFKSNFYCLLLLSALFCTNSVNSFNSSPFSGDGAYYSPHLTNLTADPAVLAHIQKHQQREEEQQKVTYTDNEQLLGSSHLSMVNSMSVNNSNSHNSFIDYSNTRNSVGGAAPQQDLYQQLQNFSPPPQLDLTNTSSISLPISNSAPSNTNSNNRPPVVTNTNWNVTSQPHFGVPQTNGNYNLNNNNSHMIGTSANTNSHNSFIYDNSTNSASGDISSVVFQGELPSSYYPSYNIGIPPVNNYSTNTFLAYQSLGLEPLGTLDDEMPFNSANMVSTDLLMDIDDNDSNENTNTNNFLQCNASDNNQDNSHVVIQKKNKNRKKASKKATMEVKKKIKAFRKKAKGFKKVIIKSTKIHICPTCKKVFNRKSGLTSHQKSHKNEKLRKCKYCPKVCNSISERIKHERIHTGEKPYKCTYCDKSFAQENNLTVHQRIHTGEKPFKCNFCEKRCKSSSNLKTHMKRHTKENQLECSICSKNITKRALRDHLNGHKGKNLYKCGQCTSTYPTKSGLKYHIKAHNRLKKYSCKDCNAAFELKSKLQDHFNYYHNEKISGDAKCHICKKGYTNKYSISKHLKTKGHIEALKNKK